MKWLCSLLMAFSLIVDTSAASTTATSVTTAAVNTTGANLLVIWTAEVAESTPGTVADSKGNSWVPVASQPAVTAGLGSRVRCWACLNPTVGSGHTVTVTADKPAVSFEAYATGSSAASVDATVGTSTTTVVTSLATGTLTPAGNNELVLSAAAFASNPSASVAAGYTALNSVAFSATNRGLSTAYQIQTTGTARNATWTVSTPSALGVAQVAFLVLASGNGTLTVSKTTVPTGSPQVFTFDAFATAAATLYTASGAVSSVSAPSWNAAGTRVTFGALGASPGIYSIHDDGTNLTNLTTTSGDDYPRYNPAGNRICYQSLVAGVYQVFIMVDDGTGQTQLTNVAGSSATRPQFNAAGTKILYVKTVTATGVGELWTMNVDGTGKALLLSMAPNNVTQGLYSANDTYLLALVTGPGAGVYRMLGDTSAQTQLMLTGTVSDFGWAPDTTGVAFTSNGSALGWANLDGFGQSTIFNSVTATYPSYNATGKVLVFVGSGGTTLLTLTALIAPAVFTLTDSTARSFTGLTPGSAYRIAETAVAGWSTVFTVSNGSITAIVIAANATTTVTATNTFSAPATTTRRIRWLRQGPYITDTENHYWITHARIEILIKAGVGTVSVPDPQLYLQYSDDYGNTWSTATARSMGASGTPLTRLVWNQKGRARDRVYRVYSDEPVNTDLVDAFVWGEGGIS